MPVSRNASDGQQANSFDEVTCRGSFAPNSIGGCMAMTQRSTSGNIDHPKSVSGLKQLFPRPTPHGGRRVVSPGSTPSTTSVIPSAFHASNLPSERSQAALVVCHRDVTRGRWDFSRTAIFPGKTLTGVWNFLTHAQALRLRYVQIRPLRTKRCSSIRLALPFSSCTDA